MKKKSALTETMRCEIVATVADARMKAYSARVRADNEQRAADKAEATPKHLEVVRDAWNEHADSHEIDMSAYTALGWPVPEPSPYTISNGGTILGTTTTA